MSSNSKDKKRRERPKSDDFASVAKRLGCDPDLSKFDAKLKKIAKVKPKPKGRK